MYFYSAYGLKIQSEIAFPELIAVNGLADVIVRQYHIPDLYRVEGIASGRGSWFKVSPRESCLIWDDVGIFQIRDGREILFDPTPGADEGLIRQAILGPAMGLLQQQRGRYPLHASAVTISGRGVAFAGDSGSGKSTLAAALHANGHALITDDIAVVEPEANPPIVFPGFPSFRMWPESVMYFGESTETLPRLHSETDKRLVALKKGFAESSIPMERVYFIDNGSSESIDPLSPQEGFLMLLRLCYHGNLLQAAVGVETLMRQCARIANRIGLFRLRRSHRLSDLPDQARMLEDHVAQGDR